LQQVIYLSKSYLEAFVNANNTLIRKYWYHIKCN